VISNPFDDILPRTRKAKINDDDTESKKTDNKGTKLVRVDYC